MAKETERGSIPTLFFHGNAPQSNEAQYYCSIAGKVLVFCYASGSIHLRGYVTYLRIEERNMRYSPQRNDKKFKVIDMLITLC